jgi:hypothetical protein
LRHGGQARGAFQAYGDVAELGERLEVASRPAAEIEDRERWVALVARSSASMFWLTS